MTRREFARWTAAGGAALLTAHPSAAAAQDTAPTKPVRIGVVGLGNRGRGLLSILVRFPGVQVPALCDLNEESVAKAADIVTNAGGAPPVRYSKTPEDYTQMLQRPDLDAVLIATPTKWHCPMAIAAMKAGKHVGSEVPAGFGLDELWQLVRAKEAIGRRYMLLENYLYNRRNMMIFNMARAGFFGELFYAECSYIHDCRFMLFKNDGSLDWWGEWARDNYGSDYPTHALGPVSKWIGLNEGDRMTHCSAMMSTPRVLKQYAAHRFGTDSPQGRIDWKEGDYTCVLIQTAQGRLLRVDYDVNSPRPASGFYLVQGTQGVYDSRSGIYKQGAGDPEQWTPADKFLAQFDHAYWQHAAAQAEATGHGGGDYFVLRDFVEMIRRDREPWVDVYDAASWSVIYHCSRESIDRRGNTVEIPDFTEGRWKDPTWRANHLKPA